MLALKKKREAEAKAKESALETPLPAPNAAGGESSGQEQLSIEQQQPQVESVTAVNSNEKVSLLGIGGKKKISKANDAGGKSGEAAVKKRTPGEIRIQKGKSFFPFNSTKESVSVLLLLNDPS